MTPRNAGILALVGVAVAIALAAIGPRYKFHVVDARIGACEVACVEGWEGCGKAPGDCTEHYDACREGCE